MTTIQVRPPTLRVSGKNKNQPHNITGRTPDLPRKHMTATVKAAFCLFLTEIIIQEIVNCTNLEGNRIYRTKRKQWNEEFYAFCGLDCAARELFSHEFANNTYGATMSIFRFEEICGLKIFWNLIS